VFWLDRRRGEGQCEADLVRRRSQIRPHSARADAASDKGFVGARPSRMRIVYQVQRGCQDCTTFWASVVITALRDPDTGE
jgi:hypothetical protein